MSAQDYDRRIIKNTNITDSAARPWTYQYCTEFGFFQVPNDKNPMRAVTLLNHDYWAEMCQSLFNITLKINRTDVEYYNGHVASTNTLFTNGGDDPWQWATELHPDAELGQIGSIAQCVDCGHCGDLYTPKANEPAPLVEQRKIAISFIEHALGVDQEKKEPLFLQKS